MKLAAIKVLVDYAAVKVASEPVEKQVVIYHALAELMPTPKGRQDARELARTLSHVAALQMDFTGALFSADPEAYVDGYKRRGGGE